MVRSFRLTLTTSLVGLVLGFGLSATAEEATPQDTARFLAGLKPSEGSPLEALTKDSAWTNHAKYFNTAWEKLDETQLSKARDWASSSLGEAYTKSAPIYYMFSGPDYLYADTFFPNGSAYLLCGLEPVGPLPDVTRLKAASLERALQQLHTALNAVLSFSFFKTKDMKNDLQNDELKGTVPLLYIFLARLGKNIQEATLVTLDNEGVLKPAAETADQKGLIRGVKITFTKADGGPMQTLYYFSTDLSNDGIKKNPGFMKFCASFGPGHSLVKSASYLMHESYFSTVRDFLLQNSESVLQDDSGIPLAKFTANKWTLRIFGVYLGPIDLFKKSYQKDLAALYAKTKPAPLPFGIGYRHFPKTSTLMLAVPGPPVPSVVEQKP